MPSFIGRLFACLLGLAGNASIVFQDRCSRPRRRRESLPRFFRATTHYVRNIRGFSHVEESVPRTCDLGRNRATCVFNGIARSPVGGRRPQFRCVICALSLADFCFAFSRNASQRRCNSSVDNALLATTPFQPRTSPQGARSSFCVSCVSWRGRLQPKLRLS